MKNVLVIGGSVFTGRVFSILASRSGDFNIHVVNRGNHPLDLERVTQYKCDRHDPGMIARLIPDISYDALVDFCAYNPGEIESIIRATDNRIKQYIFFSTASVYIPSEGFLTESAPIFDASVHSFDVVDDYINKKIDLERELIEACAGAGIKYTILRPTFIYGPFNYAPRESFFIELIAKKQPVPVPADASARFNFVYVMDIADALMRCIGNEKAYNEIFNLAGPEAVSYQRLISEFERCNGGLFETRDVTIAQVDDEMIPLPFPLTGDTLVDGGKFAQAFEFAYTPISEGLEKTYRIFHTLYTT